MDELTNEYLTTIKITRPTILRSIKDLYAVLYTSAFYEL